MKIAYVVVWDLFGPSSIAQKVNDQLAALRALGHDAQAFFLTGPGAHAQASPAVPHAEFEIESKRFGPVVKLLERPRVLRRLADRIRAFRPDLVYVRQCTYFPTLASTLSGLAPYCVEINTDELSEMRLSRPRAVFEFIRLTRARLLTSATLLVCVTHEIARIEAARYPVPTLVVGNGIDVQRVPFCPRSQGGERITVGFVGSKDAFWHGADKLVRLAGRPELADIDFVLVGPARDELPSRLPRNVQALEHLEGEELDRVTARFDAAIATAALHRKHMHEASPLKTRYYLARGIPSVLPYLDTDVPADSDFVLSVENGEDNLDKCVSELSSFFRRVRGDEALRSKARAFAEQRLDFKPKLASILEAVERRRRACSNAARDFS